MGRVGGRGPLILTTYKEMLITVGSPQRRPGPGVPKGSWGRLCVVARDPKAETLPRGEGAGVHAEA